MDGKVFSKETKKLIKEIGDDAIKLGIIGELIDGPMISAAVDVIDHYGDRVIPDEYDAPINSIATKALNEDSEGARTELATLTNKIVDVPVLDEASEELVFQSGYAFLVNLISNWLKKKIEANNE